MRTPAAIRCGEPAKTSPRTEPATARTTNASAPRWTRTRVEVFRLRRERAETARESATTKARSLAPSKGGNRRLDSAQRSFASVTEACPIRANFLDRLVARRRLGAPLKAREHTGYRRYQSCSTHYRGNSGGEP